MLKYYLRGLGIGIIVTTLILAIVHKVNGSMTDSEIKERASELGMVMANETEDSILDKTEPEDTEVDKPTGEETTEEPATEVSNDPVTEPATEEITEPVTEPPTEPVTEPPTAPVTEPPTEPPTEPGTDEPALPSGVTTTTIEIVSGMYSEAVSRLLVERGIIENGGDFNTYLENNGYAERIATGTFTVSSDMSYEQIARIITRS